VISAASTNMGSRDRLAELLQDHINDGPAVHPSAATNSLTDRFRPVHREVAEMQTFARELNTLKSKEKSAATPAQRQAVAADVQRLTTEGQRAAVRAKAELRAIQTETEKWSPQILPRPAPSKFAGIYC
jgi:hypothetical protein